MVSFLKMANKNELEYNRKKYCVRNPMMNQQRLQYI